MNTQCATSESTWKLDAGPFIFHGKPPLCTGHLQLKNPTDQKLKVRKIPVVGLTSDGIANFALTELTVGIGLSPRSVTSARASFLIDPYTPPGTYSGEIAYGSQRERITVHVWEKTSLALSPKLIRLRGGAEDTIRTNIVVTNRGNVMETLRGVTMVYLEESHWVGRSMVYALREVEVGEGHQSYLDRVVKELRSTIASPMRVNIQSPPLTLHPGQAKVVELSMTLPPELKKGRHYFASAKFMSKDLLFDVECNGAKNSKLRRPR